MTDANNSGNNPPSTDPNPLSITPPPAQWIIGTSTPTLNSNGFYTWTSGTISGDVLTSGDATTAKAEKKKGEGCSCKRCKEFNSYAEPNQEDGSFVCYRCRKGW